MSRTLTIDLPEETFDRLTRLASERGQPREVVAADLLARELGELADDPLLKWVGAIESEAPDVAERHDHYLGEALHRDLAEGHDG